MRHAYTLLFLVWGSVLILMGVVKLLRGKAFADAAALGCMGLIGIALAVVVWTFTGRMEKERSQTTAIVEQTNAAAVAPAERSGALARRMANQLLIALAVWFAVVVLVSLAGGILLRDMRYARTIGMLRFGTLFWKSFLIVLAADGRSRSGV